MERLTKKDKNGKYYIVEEKICIGTELINPIRTWIVDNENRGYGNPINRLGELEDLLENADSIKIIKRNGVASLHIDMILDNETYPIAEQLFGKDKVIDFDK